jgi:glucose/arabinose dehydrogenase
MSGFYRGSPGAQESRGVSGPRTRHHLAPDRASRNAVVAAVLVALAVAACSDGRGVPASSPVSATPVQSGLAYPWDIAFAPDGTMFVTERPGRILVYEDGQEGASLLHEVTVPDVRSEAESGLLGIAIDSDVENQPYLYVCASVDGDGAAGDGPWTNDVFRYRLGEDWEPVLDQVLIEGQIRARERHDGCAVEMDADRVLWITMGDSLGAAKFPQDPGSLNGKILRMNPDGSIPSDNPVLPGADGPSLVYSMGHRNPQGIAFASNGDVFNTEHGTRIEDEINQVVAGSNYGYPCYIGDAENPEPPKRAKCPADLEVRDPAWSSGDATIATSGAVFLADPRWGEWEDSLVVATLKQQDLRRFVISDDGEAELVDTLLDEAFGRLRAAVIAPDGALYLTTSNGEDDKVIRVEPVEQP